MAAPFSVIEPMLDAFRIQNFRDTIRFMASVIPFSGANDDAHVIVLPRVGCVWQIFVRAVEVNVVVMVTIENELISNEPLRLMR